MDTPFFEFSFLSGEATSDVPALVAHGARVRKIDFFYRLNQYVETHTDASHQYFGKTVQFAKPLGAAVGRIAFGYQNCASLEVSETDITITFPLQRELVGQSAYTLQLVLAVLFLLRSANDSQHPVTIATSCTHRNQGSGHAASGALCPATFAQLLRICQSDVRKTIEQQVSATMQRTWKAVTEKYLHQFAGDCYVRLLPDGRFILMCFGDACDLSIYPESVERDPDERVVFESHNLDTAAQQLTLLSGLFQLISLAREVT